MLTDWQRWNGSSVIGPNDPGDWYFLDNTGGWAVEGACWHTLGQRSTGDLVCGLADVPIYYIDSLFC